MSKELFVGSLSWRTTSEELKDAFALCGDVVEARVVTDGETGRSRGFGFVTFEAEQGAARALKRLDGSALNGRTIRVGRADSPGEDNRGSFGRW